jgi:hypothetical protein
VTEAAAWELLEKLEFWSAQDALTLIREACAAAGGASTRFQ